MDGIYETNESFQFNKLNLLSPVNIPGGNYFIKFRINDAPLYIQPPKCKTRQGFLKSGKKIYCDLMFSNENETFIQWTEKLEEYCRTKIFENRSKWFDIELDEHDIENSFTSPLKIFKSGKYYISRTNVPTKLDICSLKVYNEDEEEVNIENIKDDTEVMTILEIQGIKCSTKNFQIEIELKQMMVLKKNNIFEKCLLKNTNNDETKPNLTTAIDAESSIVTLKEINKNEQLGEPISISQENITESILTEEPLYEYVKQDNEIMKDHTDIVCETQPKRNNKNNMESINTIQQDKSGRVYGAGGGENTTDCEGLPEKSGNIGVAVGGANTTNGKGLPEQSDNNIDNKNSEINKNETDKNDNEKIKKKKQINENETNKEKELNNNDQNDILEIEFDLDKIAEMDTIHIKKRNYIYYEMYKEAKRKAKIAKDLAISSFLEAKHIKNTYLLEDFEDSESDLEEAFYENELK